MIDEKLTNKEFMEALQRDAMEEPYTTKVKDVLHALDERDDLLQTCLTLIDELEAMEQEHGISMLTASNIHDAKVLTLNAQGLVEEGYNDN